MTLKTETQVLLARLGVSADDLKGGDLNATSPLTGETLAQVKTTSPGEASAAISRAQEAFLIWRSVPAPKRGELVRLLGEELRTAKDDLAKLVTIEAGKIPSEGAGEVQGGNTHSQPRVASRTASHHLRGGLA